MVGCFWQLLLGGQGGVRVGVARPHVAQLPPLPPPQCVCVALVVQHMCMWCSMCVCGAAYVGHSMRGTSHQYSSSSSSRHSSVVVNVVCMCECVRLFVCAPPKQSFLAIDSVSQHTLQHDTMFPRRSPPFPSMAAYGDLRGRRSQADAAWTGTALHHAQ